MRDEAQKIVDVCKEFVRSMSRLETSLGSMAASLSKEERSEVLEAVLAWLGSEEVPEGLTRDVSRELIAQLSASAMYADYRGSPESYIQ